MALSISSKTDWRSELEELDKGVLYTPTKEAPEVEDEVPLSLSDIEPMTKSLPPDIDMLPATSSFELGLVVPIPTLVPSSYITPVDKVSLSVNLAT